jgi:hypothetical protein
MIAARQPRCNRAWLIQHFASGADRAIDLKLGKRLLILLVAPIDITALVDGSRRPEKPEQALVEQRLLGAFLFGDRTMWRAGRRHPSRARPAAASVFAGGHSFPVRGSPRSR